MDKTVRKLATLEQAKDEEYRYWQSVPASERIRAGFELSVEGYRTREHPADGRGLKTTLIRLQR